MQDNEKEMGRTPFSKEKSVIAAIITELVVLIITSISDIKTGKGSPLLILLGAIAQVGFIAFYGNLSVRQILAGIALSGIIFIIPFLFGNLGGIDFYLALTFGLTLGTSALFALLLSLLFSLPVPIYMKVKKCEREYPFVPFMMAGYVVTIIISFLFGGFLYVSK